MNAPMQDIGLGFRRYAGRVQGVLSDFDWAPVVDLAGSLLDCWRGGRQLFLCGNGGSAANATHLANDLLYGIAKSHGQGMRVNALTANAAVLTCLGNDLGYEEIFSEQLAVHGQSGDILLAFSGSGNSPNILRALETARQKQIRSYAVLGYTGGRAKAMVDVPIHFPIDDMQISEDMQLIVGHMIMQWLYENRPSQEVRT